MCNSISFLDTLTLKREDGNPVPVLNTGIAWPSDKQMKFRNPPNSQTNLSEGKNQFKAWPYIWYLHHCFFFSIFNNSLQGLCQATKLEKEHLGAGPHQSWKQWFTKRRFDCLDEDCRFADLSQVVPSPKPYCRRLQFGTESRELYS